MDESDQKTDGSGISRRTALKALSGSAVASPVAFSGAASGKEQSDSPKQELSKTTREATEEEANLLVESDIFEAFQTRMRIPSYDASSANTTEIRLDGAEISKTIGIDTKYGTVSGPLGNEAPSSLIFTPDDEEIPPGLKKQYSGELSWKDDLRTYITTHGVDQPIVYSRETTQSEEKRIADGIEGNGGRFEPEQTLVTTSTENSEGDKLKLKSESEMWAISEKSTYRFEYESGDLASRERTTELFGAGSSRISQQAVDCNKQSLACLMGIVTSMPGCAVAASGCALSTIAAGGCAVIVLSICAPGAAVSVRDCAVWCMNCSSDC
ncbi:hypothetical protein [Halolamina salifodinae]|uniref:Uncharacterized protein n=1 Tax=Halolamina salifodinae TaxID=1202767 RepID=A0A8T4GYH0_9EURY|nr:hypothetical protein [Halolamina salifodinae]MBP1988057.1 hypothetical protein [Halolamina salifodinae]